MKVRCYNKNFKDYDRYGGRGIRVCERWLHSFENFLADMGHRPGPGYSVDQFPDNDGNYEPDNCRWATATEQARNRRVNRFVTFNGSSKTLSEWATITGIRRDTLEFRIKSGWSPDKAMTTPTRRFHLPPEPCCNCGLLTSRRTHDRCSRCATYLRKKGTDRPKIQADMRFRQSRSTA